ncbi:hypothetical protein MAPG_11063 [Magnaporthiopsis poae ATCC 64411]|uniref:DNA replication checkpoint mediator MRC1 domain-containing protein n=1 Tax=Magnaporthiopsis poae (strain ATCC 64411 / 73-15) TaxID=644358 RepID=A0A0C4EE95_MAGP6|nr:hypothetical protein MAPG_11063 [Magnaporthiopsis poae ATCC 64411]
MTMALSRSPSPAVSARRSNSSSPQLTPRSKLRKMLAAIDSSDEESSGTTRLFRPAARLVGAISKSPTPQADSDSDDQDILRPRGRLAARMQAGEASPKDIHAPTKPASRSTPEPDTHATEQADDEDDEDDEVMTRHPRRQKPAKAQTPTRQRSPASSAASSPAMFVTPSKDRAASLAAASPLGSGDEGELPEDPTKSKRFRARLLELREKRVREAEEKARREAEERGSEPAAADSFINDEEDDGLTDDEGGHKLTQGSQARPSARKASKKALEEMHRETQRLNRNLQLAHEAKTKTKVTKASLFERFNFKPAGAASVPEKPVAAPANSSRPSSPVSIHHTDAETKEDDTPPTSPPTVQKDDAEAKADTAAQVTESMQAGASEVAEVRFSKLDKGKGKATAADLEKDEPVLKRRQFRVTLPAVQANMVTVDDDEEQLIVAQKTKLDALFDRVPARRQETDQSLHALRILAQIGGGSDGKDGVAAGRRGMKQLADNAMTAGELQASLHRRAREQARLERERRLEALRAKGVHVQTEEEREQELRDIEDIVARARREAEEIMLREKEETKKERKESGAVGPLAWDDSDDGEDGDFQDEEQEVAEVELSGSEDEDAVMDDGQEEEEEDQEDDAMDGLVDEQADSADESADQASEDEDADEDGGVRLTKQKSRRVKKQITVILDDEDDTDNEAAAPTPKSRAVEATPRPKAAMFKSPSARGQQSPQEPTSVLRSATKTFIPGLPVKMGESAGLGLTQIFAGTMDDSQANLAAGSPSQPMPTFEDFHGPNLSQPQHEELILNSQPTQMTQPGGDDSQGVQLNLAQSQAHGLDSLMRDDVFATATQQSDWLEPTQDEGFQHRSPLKRRFVEDDRETPAPSAIVDSTQPESVIQSSPLVRKGKLRRKAAVPEDDHVEHVDDVEEPRAAAADAFDVLNKAAVKEKRRKQQEEFDRKKSKAKEMFEEQAEESEDEYAGLGGADGEDSDDDGRDVEGMIDDKTGVSESDKAKIAALYADRERASDEKQVEKLFRDITTGMLRRKRGNDYDLSDDDDGGEARRRMKRRQFAKMQKALFADERVSKVAENPRTSAFMRTIEDRGSDDEDMDDLLVVQPPKPESSEEDSQEAADESIPDSQPKQQQHAMAPPPRLPGPQRRTLDGKKPSNLGEIRESLSNLLEDQKSMSSMISATDVGSDSEGEDRPAESSNKENQNPQRRAAVAVVDRISLKRSGSSTSEVSAPGGLRRTGSGSRAAFVMAGGGVGGNSGSFKVPALLRRATSNSVASLSSSTTASSTGVTSGPAAAAASGGGAGFGDDAKIKKNASKRSGINYFARETERLAALAEKERRREARKWKGAEGRSKVVGGLFSAGKFE